MKRSLFLALLFLATLFLQGCFASQSVELQRNAIQTRAANEHDCHLNHVTVVVVEDKKGIFRSTGCGHEEFWQCVEDEYGPEFCDRVDFPADSMFLRF